ncbi:MAG: hypothetical protein JO056_10610 [Alphaproteobacteria bacterium]|jgi:hypothetical protein|nr:hypothetical protein [Alphaproteobacteria bacterium]
MDRRYYLLKLATVAIAIVLAMIGGGISGSQATHGPGFHATYTAPAQMQTAAWQATRSAARLVVCMATRALHTAV